MRFILRNYNFLLIFVFLGICYTLFRSSSIKKQHEMHEIKDIMKFQEVAQVFNKIEPIASRLEITHLLSELFKKANPEEAKIIAYLSLGSLNSPYVGTKFNFAEKNIIKVIARLLDISEPEIKEQLKKYGDLGTIIEHGTWKNNSDLTVEEVYNELLNIEKIAGTGSQEIKLEHVYKLMKDLDPVSAKYIARILTDTLRLGFSDMTIIDAVSWMLAGNKSLRSKIEEEYNLCADIGLIVYNAKNEGLDSTKKLEVHVGIPIRLAAAERLTSAKEIVEKLGHCVAQPKLDGFRLQIHINNDPKNKVMKFFSRNLIDMSQMFPDLVKELEKLNIDSVIFDSEAIVYDVNTGSFVPFQETVKRKRKHGIDQAAQEMPLQLFIFDILYLNGELLLKLPHEARRAKLIEVLKSYNGDILHVIEEKKINTAKELEDYFLKSIESGLEGLVVKKPDSQYQPGKRNFNWIKLKRQASGHLADSIDCVILGYYFGAGKRAKFEIGAFLVGVYNEKKDLFQTIAKIGTGLTDEEWIELKKKCEKIKVGHEPTNIECDKNLYPDVWVWPELVCEVVADEITLSPIHTAGKTEHQLGIALRFPRFIGYRTDKSADESTSIKELHEMYEMQFKKN